MVAEPKVPWTIRTQWPPDDGRAGMRWDELEEEPCSMARTIGVIGDRWTLLILRECFLRTRRFEGFQSALGITRHMVDERGRPLLHEHRKCGKMFDPVMVCSECGEPLSAKEVQVHPGPGARPTPERVLLDKKAK